jgi:hypothetical protein
MAFYNAASVPALRDRDINDLGARPGADCIALARKRLDGALSECGL